LDFTGRRAVDKETMVMLRNSKEVVAVEMPLDFEGCDQLHLTFPTGAVLNFWSIACT
jgi:hypothetical protein